MPAVSGSPTQISSSVSTPADLAGTPDDAFKTGDLACVETLMPNGTFRLNRKATGPADNVTKIAAHSGNGYWEVFGTGGGGGDPLAGDVIGPNSSNVVENIHGVPSPNPIDGIAEGDVVEVSSGIFLTPRALVGDGVNLYVGQSGQDQVQSSIVLKLSMGGFYANEIQAVAQVDLSSVLPTVDRVRDLAVDSVYVYATTWDASNVAIIDKTTFQVVGWAYVGLGKRAVSVCSDDAGHFYVTTNSQLMKFAVASCLGQPPSTVAPATVVSASGRWIRYGATSGKLWLTNGNGSGPAALRRIDPGTLNVESSIATLDGSQWSMTSIEAFGSVWVTGGPGGSRVYRIDPATMNVLASISPVAPFASNGIIAGICLGPDNIGTPNSWIYVVSMYGGPYAGAIDPTVGSGAWATTYTLDSRPDVGYGDVASLPSVSAGVIYAAAFDDGSGRPTGIDYNTFGSSFGMVATPTNDLVLKYKALNGDVVGAPSYSTVAGLRNVPIQYGTPSLDSYLRYDGSQWTYAGLPGQQWFGHLAIVDPVNGNDATASVNGKPFLTIPAALAAANAAANSNIRVYVLILPGVYSLQFADLPLTIGQYVSMGGLSRNSTLLQGPGQSAPTGFTMIVHGGDDLDNLSINSTGGRNDQTIIGVVAGVPFQGAGRVSNCYVYVDTQQNSSNPTPPGTEVVGIDLRVGSIANNCDVYATGGAFGVANAYATVKGIRGNGTAINCRVTAFEANNLPGGSARGAEVADPSHTLSLIGGMYIGTSVQLLPKGACIRQTQGSLRVADVALQPGQGNSLAGGLGFTVEGGGGSGMSTWQYPGAVVANATRFMYASAVASVNEIQSRVAARRVAKSISVRVQSPPVSSTDTWTLRKNGADTGLTVSLSGNATSAVLDTVSVDYEVGDTFSMKQVTGANSTTAEVVVDVEWYEG